VTDPVHHNTGLYAYSVVVVMLLPK